MKIDPLFVDTYPGDRPCDWSKFIAGGAPWHGAVFKLSQGLNFEYADWVLRQRRQFLESTRYGFDLFDGMYHYLDLGTNGALQAEWFCELVQQVGGERTGTLWGMVDVERAGQRVALTKTRVESCISQFAERYFQLTGRRATLYGGELLRAIGATSLYGCGRSSVALYSAELHGRGETTAQFLRRTGTDLAHLLFWQYDGTESSTGPVGYPRAAPGCPNVDISALVSPGGIAGLRARLWSPDSAF